MWCGDRVWRKSLVKCVSVQLGVSFRGGYSREYSGHVCRPNSWVLSSTWFLNRLFYKGDPRCLLFCLEGMLDNVRLGWPFCHC